MKFDLYGDGIGTVEYVQHMGEDITVVNAARVSFGKHKETMDDKDRRLIKYLIKHIYYIHVNRMMKIFYQYVLL